MHLTLTEARKRFEDEYLRSILQLHRGNVSRAAEQSGKHRSEFYSLLKRHAIDPGSYRSTSASDSSGR